uniref:Uncharacterized protein n=1 Tax=Stegastes partitus TaxID=144197 RepID=A0A3B5AKZ3_9TELE
SLGPVSRWSVMSQTPILSVLPTRTLVDEKFKVLVENLPPACPVTVRSLHHSEDNHDWEAFGFYVSDHGGTVNVSKDLSFGGTYTGQEPMGLLWSMCPVPGSREADSILVTEQWTNSFPLRSCPGPFPGILDLWGGGGGLMEYRSALLASHGYATMSLDYLGCDQPEFSYAEVSTAFNIIKDHPQVIEDRVGVFGISLGSLVALYLYPGAGHLIEPPFSPHFRVTNFMTSERGKVVMLWGGHTKPHADAQEDSWRKILSFLQQHLYCRHKAKL